MASRANSADPRAARVRAAMRAAALKLAHTKRIEDISVLDITKAAGVSRAAFYQHFTDRDDAVAAAFIEQIHQAVGDESGLAPESVLDRVARHADEHRNLYVNVYPSRAAERVASALREQMLTASHGIARSFLPEHEKTPIVDVITTLIVGGMFELIHRALVDEQSARKAVAVAIDALNRVRTASESA